MAHDITRRDFLNAATLGSGMALLGAAAPGLIRAANIEPPAATDGSPRSLAWTGYSGVGDYARSNGNTFGVMSAGHGIRDHRYEAAIAGAKPTGETFDLVIVGGGYSGVFSAYGFLKEAGRRRRCLILENHPVMGGEAKRNEFDVRGQRLVGPQGSNESGLPETELDREIWKAAGLPLEFEFAKLTSGRQPMEFPSDNYMYLLWADQSENHGFFFDSPQPHWVRNPWGHKLEGTPWSKEVRRDLLRWRDEPMKPFNGSETELKRWLDTMTYDDFLTKVRKLHPDVGRYADPIVASGLGLGSDVTSANAAYFFSYPGFQGLSREATSILVPQRRLPNARSAFSFPGGNDGVMRGMLKWLNPDMIEGSESFPDVYSGRFRFEAMDRPADACRMRTGATVVRVVQDSEG
ncbi:MAG TPA: NAD(P)-binding protein, partial [Steroidobacteraceae bacterium]|nr:NAD(P)-binding protein [Steroidobacteraceae bacterium]